MRESYVPIAGMKFGLGPDGPLFMGRPVGAHPAAQGRGQTIYLDSKCASGSGESPRMALRSLREAMKTSIPHQGDTIVVMPWHTEVLTGEAFQHMVAGVRVIGLGAGSSKPRFILEGVSYLITAAGAYIENVVVSGVVGASGKPFAGIDVGARGAALVGVEFAGSFSSDVKVSSTMDNVADGLSIIGCRGASDAMLEVEGNLDRLTMHGNIVHKDLIRGAAGKAVTNADIDGNRFFTSYGSKDKPSVVDVDGELKVSAKAA